MENRFYIKELDSYQRASDLSKERMGTNPNYDLELLPTKQMQEEMWEFLQYRGKNLVAEKFYTERRFYHHLCRMLKEKNNRPESFMDWDKEKWMQQMKIWLLQQGLSLTAPFKNKCGGRGTQRARTLGYIECLIDYLTDLRDADVNEITKDVWKIEKLDIQVKQDLIRPRKTISFTGISQPELKEEIKKAVYFQLRIESLETVKKELTAIRRFSRYLNEHKKNVKSCADFDRTIIEEYLVYMKTEDTGTKRYRSEITRLRSILNMVADIYQYPQAKDLILNRDIPPNIKAEFKVYSDAELKRFNEFLLKVDIQTARVMTIHQMLGTRISDTLTLQTDCLMEQNGEVLIRIYQMKTHFYEKPISQELAALIREAIHYTEERNGKCKYIFTNENDHTKPMTYSLIQGRITAAIHRENLRDDNGNYFTFTFGTHMYRHVYGVKLVEMHLDDWTIARLLGHKSLKNVKYYRKMSNQILANDTRKARNRLSQMVLECLDGWEEEYEQIRCDDSL